LALKLLARVEDRKHEVIVERHDGRYTVTLDGTRYDVDAREIEGNFYSLLVGGASYEVSVEPEGASSWRVRHGAVEQEVAFTDPSRRGREELAAGGAGPLQVTTLMPGKVVRVLVAEGDEVAAGQGLVVVEAMKMENEVVSPRAGRVSAVHVQPGQAVEAGGGLVLVE
jgi:biotin carboxyl carrier protein